MAIEIIPPGASAIATSHDKHADRDWYGPAERVKDGLSRLEIAVSDRAAGLAQDICGVNNFAAEHAKDVIEVDNNNSRYVTREVNEGNRFIRKDITDTEYRVTAETRAESRWLHSKMDRDFSDAAKDRCDKFDSLKTSIFMTDKDVALLNKDLQISEKNLSLLVDKRAAEAALTACHNQSATMLEFKAAALQAAQDKFDLSKQMAECCCELKELVRSETGDVKDALKQQEIDSLRAQLLDAKSKNRSRVFQPVPAGTLVATED